ncbi:MAG: nucleoside triphosphate pyrophosphatase [Candidatus Sedimenticola endophacoides]
MLPSIYLASLSPRRRELLGQIGVDHEAIRVQVDETPHPGEAPVEYVIRLALEKAGADLSGLGERSPRPVLGADTAVVADGRILGKPAHRGEALEMLSLLSGRSHKVLTGVALTTPGREWSRLSVSRVTFREVTEREANAYWESGEPMDKAGGYAIQGVGALFIRHLEGSFSGVMGLPLFETAQLLREAGIGLLGAQPKS